MLVNRSFCQAADQNKNKPDAVNIAAMTLVSKSSISKLSSLKKHQAMLKASGLAFSLLALSACGGSSDSEDAQGYIKFYNASADAPNIYLTIDENLDEDEEDEFEQTFSSVAYGKTGSRIQLDTQSYYMELAWQNEDSSVRSDLEIVFEDQIIVDEDVTKWIVMSDSIQNPRVDIFEIPDISDDEADDDQDDDLFNLRFVNLHDTYTDIDFYLSGSDETFNEAVLVTGLQSYALSENFKFEEDQYKFYITTPGSTEVLFTSDEVDYAFGGQYLISIRENQGVGGSPFTIDNISNSSITQYDALESMANVAVYNGLDAIDLLPAYDAKINVLVDGTTDIPLLEDLVYGDFSETYEIDSGDYRFTVSDPSNNDILLQNRALSMPQNTNRTLFLYWTEEAVDDDGDGDVDEDDDGQVDEYRAIVSSLVVDNSDRSRLYDKELTLLNLVNSDDFTTVTFYFVKSDEIIETAENQRNVIQGNATSLVLRNNTYQLFVVAEIDNNEIIIDEQILVLDETETDQFLILEHSIESSSGYEVRVVDQNSTDD